MRWLTRWRTPFRGCPNDVRLILRPIAPRPSFFRSKGECAGGDERLYLAPQSTDARKMRKAPVPGPFLFVTEGAPHCCL